MARMPMVPEDYFASDQNAGMQSLPYRGGRKPEMKPLPLARDDENPSISDMLYRYPQPPRGTALTLFMEPHDIASVSGLPDHVYESLGDHADQMGDADGDVRQNHPEQRYAANQVRETGFFPHSPPAGPPLERKLPPDYVPEDGYNAFGRALANGVLFNAPDGIAAMADATFPGINSRSSRAPIWAQRAQENADAQYRTSVADKHYHPVATAAGEGAAYLVNPTGVLFPSKSLVGAAVTGAVLGGAKQLGENLRTRNPDVTHDVLKKAAEGAASRSGFYRLSKGKGR